MKTAHIALQYKDKKEADIWFSKILGLDKEKEFTLKSDLSRDIFGIDRDVDAALYSDGETAFEVFFTGEKPSVYYEHICLVVEEREDFLALCRDEGLQVNEIKKGEKALFFVTDHAGYLYEVKEGAK